MLLTKTTATCRVGAGSTRLGPKLPSLRQTRVFYRTDSDTEVTPAAPRSELRNKPVDRLAEQSRRPSDAVSTLETPELQQMEVEEIRELEVEDGVQQTLDRLQAKWQSIQDKRTVVVLGLGSLLGTWLASKTLEAVNHIPILPIGDLLTFVGLIFSANFIWRFVLFSEGRKELYETVSDFYQNARDTIEADPTLAPITDATIEKAKEPERPLNTSSSNGSQQNGAKRTSSGEAESPYKL